MTPNISNAMQVSEQQASNIGKLGTSAMIGWFHLLQ
jgi:hypothetical protein